MIFYGKPGERVWDDELSRRVCLFDHRGELQTENEYVMAELLRRGYRSDRPGEAVYRVGAAHEDEKAQRKRKGE